MVESFTVFKNLPAGEENGNILAWFQPPWIPVLVSDASSNSNPCRSQRPLTSHGDRFTDTNRGTSMDVIKITVQLLFRRLAGVAVYPVCSLESTLRTILAAPLCKQWLYVAGAPVAPRSHTVAKVWQNKWTPQNSHCAYFALFNFVFTCAVWNFHVKSE